ncbi:MAG: IS200/IS605 family transposase [Methanothrix sp.]|nr:IS200/IS605 family transposase [Methanothrix sp.]
MVELESANHCVYKIRYHMVLCVKYRKKLLYDSDKIEFIKFICSEIEQRYSVVFDTIGTDGDHLHVFVGAAPKYSPSKIMQIIKSILARELFKRYPEIKKQLWGGHFWSEGGYIGTVGDDVTSEIVRDYINKQGIKNEPESYAQLKLIDFS